MYIYLRLVIVFSLVTFHFRTFPRAINPTLKADWLANTLQQPIVGRRIKIFKEVLIRVFFTIHVSLSSFPA